MSFESVCKFYTYNRNCKFGKNCRYIHSDLSQRPPPYSEEESNGAVKQKRGQPQQASPSSLQFALRNLDGVNHETSLSHPSSLIKVSSDFEKSELKRSDDDVSQGLAYQSAPVTGASVSDNKDPAVTQSRPRSTCRYLKQHGYCTFGRNCRFLHTSDSDGRFQSETSKPRFSQNAQRETPPRFQRRGATSKSKIAVDGMKLDGNNDVESNLQNGHDDISNPPVGCETRGTPKASKGNYGKLCKYFKSGYCSRGRRCMFLHQRDDKKEKGEEITKQRPETRGEDVTRCDLKSESLANENDKASTKYQRPVSVRPTGILPQVVKLSELQSSGVEKYRQFDLNYLKKRFQAVIYESDDTVEGFAKLNINESILDVTFSPSDPDWPFDVRTFLLRLTFPEDYPEKAISVAVPSDKQDLPDTVRRYLEICMNEWVADRQQELTRNGKAELMVRPFFRWLDRNFEDVMTEALKQLKRELTARAAGFEFIPATHLKAKYAADEEDDNGSISREEAYDSLAEEGSESSDECLESDESEESDESDEEEERPGSRPALDLDTQRKGTEITLRHLQLKQNASSLLFERLHLLVQCVRCKTQSEVSVGREKAVASTCHKCNQEMFIQYRPTLAHQFSSIIGYLDLDNCQAFDLIFPDCKMVVSCLSCGKLTKINGMTSGQLIDGWCQACNGRFKFATESIKFYQLQSSGLDEEKKQQAEVSKPKGIKKVPKDPAIREGEPLPDFGACRHYKQSYRWLRFPCCGKAYPCDVCHEKKEDHEMILANRMICGHCSKEQNYSPTRPCNTCGHHMTKVRSAHWEGGMGCRNRISMSRNDQHKYKNMNKTVSKKKASSGSGSTKKNTKLRHA